MVGVHPRLQTLLALVLLSPGFSIDRIRAAALLWPDSTESQARTNLRHLLHTLRSVFPQIDDYIQIKSEILAWDQNAEFHFDVSEFTHAAFQTNSLAYLDQAITLYTGDLLPNCYDDWIEPERSRLRNIYLGILIRQTELLEKDGDLRGAIQAANRLVHTDPLSEASYCRLMELYASLGDRSAIQRTFEACISVLKKELGVEPGPETRAVFEALQESKQNLELQGKKVSSFHLRKNNMPAPLDEMIGRKEEKLQLLDLILKHRLVTLTGIGGVGKTRLAQEIAWELIQNTDSSIAAEGVWWIDLSPISSLELLSQTVAAASHVVIKINHSIMDSLMEELANRRVLLVLDNCEHLLEITAQFIFNLLRACPHLRVITTSRVSLHLAGETLFYVPPLPIQADDPSSLSESELLFYERASAVNSTFGLRADYRDAVRAICRRLDGIPLAIELAAARTRLLSPIEIANKLENVFQLLVQKKHGIPPRHQTLRSTLNWSYQLLSESEGGLFRCLSVFSNGFTLESAMSVCGCTENGTDKLLNDMEALIDKNLLRPAESTASQPRSNMLELIREYAMECLIESGKVHDIRRKHALFFLDLAIRIEPLLESPQQASWLDQLEAEHANLRSALIWMRETGDIHNGLGLASALALFYFMRGYLREGFSWLVDFLAISSDTEISVRAKACDRAGLLARHQGAFEQAIYWISESLSIRRQLNDLHGIADSLNNLGAVALYQENLPLALDYYNEALVIHQQLNNLQGIADSYSHLAILAYQRDNFQEAESMHQMSLDIWRGLEDQQGVAWALCHLGQVSLAKGELIRARNQFRESLELSDLIGFRWGVVNAIEGIACYAALTGQPAAALKLAGGSAHFRNTFNIPLPSGIEIHVNRMLSLAYNALEQEQSRAFFTQGEMLPYKLLIEQTKQL